LKNSGKSNTAIGYPALYSNALGGGSTALGYGALYYTTGYFNVAVGQEAGISITTGSNNIDIGSFGSTGDADTIRIGNNQSAIFLAGIAGQTVGAGGSTCYVDNNGKLGVFLSARRFKTDIADMGNASDTLLRLRPVTFRYKPEMKATDAPQFGLIAEEVAEVNPDLVVRDAKGELSTVRYEAVNAMLLNEFLKEHRKVEELASATAKQEALIARQQKEFQSAITQQRKDFQATTAQQQKEIQVLMASLTEQAAQIRKVGAQLEANKPAPKTVFNER